MEKQDKAKKPSIVLEVVLDKEKDKSYVVTRSQNAVLSKERFSNDDDIAQVIADKAKTLSGTNNLKLEQVPVIIEGKGINSQLREELKSKGLRALQKNSKDKDYYYDYYYDDYVYYEPLPVTPWGVISFDDLEQAEAAKELSEDYMLLLAQYTEMAQRILDGNYYLSFGDERGVYSLMTDLTQQFLNKLEQVTADHRGDLRKEVDETKLQDSMLKLADLNTIKAKAAAEEVIVKEEKEPELIAKNKGVMLFKNADGDLIWAGIHSNKFKDRDGDILTEDSHRRFVKMVEKGDYPYPELWIWHIEKAVGETNWLAYDARGFLLSGGKVFPEYEELVTELVSNTPDMGMSHGMPIDTVIYDDEGYIKEYQSKEVTMLPIDEAANILTHFATEKK